MARILIVEDYRPDLELLRDLLEAQGHEVLSVTTAEAALTTAAAEHPDLVLMDLSLPAMDGLEATRRLKGSPDTRDICVAILTAHAMKSEEEQAWSTGCDAYFTKPIDTRTFAKVIDCLLGLRLSSGAGPRGLTPP